MRPAQDPPVGAPTTLFRFEGRIRPGSSARRGGGYDVTADGRRLLYVLPSAGATARRMVLVQNWLAGFKGKGAR
jgi:hypothetical protein